MKVVLIILMFCYAAYMAETIKNANRSDSAFKSARPAFYASMTVITIAYLGMCTYLVWLLR